MFRSPVLLARLSPSLVAAVLGLAVTVPTAAAVPTAAGPLAYAAGVEPAGFAGTGTAGFAGDGGKATDAQFDDPLGVAVSPDGTVYIADKGNRVVRAVSPDGVVRTVAGTAPDGGAVTPVPPGAELPGTEVTLAEPSDVAVDRDGTVLIADAGAFRVLALSPQGQVTLYAGTGSAGFSGDDGPATEAQLGAVQSIATGPDGTVYLGDPRSRRVRAVGSDGVIETVMGNGEPDVVGAGPAAEVGMPYVSSLAVDGDGTVWVASSVLQRLADGRVSTVVRSGDGRWQQSDPATVTLPAGAVIAHAVSASGDSRYVLEDDGLWRFRQDGALDRVAEGRWRGGVAVGPSGEVYVADPAGNRVLRVVPETADNGNDRDGDGSGGSNWPLVAGGGAAVVILALLAVWLTRRRGGTTRGSAT